MREAGTLLGLRLADERIERDDAEAGEAGEAFEAIPIRRQAVGLLVGHHLQAVLDDAQETVGGAEIVAPLAVDPAAVGQRRERPQRLLAAQPGMVVLAPKRPSRYGRLRREPRSDGLSTIEATAMLLARLERKPEIQTALNASFERLLARYRQTRPISGARRRR